MIKFFLFAMTLLTGVTSYADACLSYFLSTQIKELNPISRVSALNTLRTKIQMNYVKSQAERKVLIVDLDDTLFLTQRRVLNILKDYDFKNDSSLFQKITIQDLKPENYRASILTYLQKTLRNPVLVSLEFLKFGNHIRRMFQQDMNLVFDEPNMDLIRELHYWSARGVEVLYVTGRHKNQQRLSELYLQLAFAPAHGFFFKSEYKQPTEKHKRAIIEKFLSEGIDILAMVDDYTSNFKELEGILPKDRLFLIRYNHETIWYTNNH